MFLFIAKKEESVDYCRGCRMASYSSDFFIENWLNQDSLISTWAEYLLKNMNLDFNELGYDFYIFKDGIKVFTEHAVCWDGNYHPDYSTEEFDAKEKEDKKEIEYLCEIANTLAKEKQFDKKEMERKRLAEEEAKGKERERLERLRQFNLLKKEFE